MKTKFDFTFQVLLISINKQHCMLRQLKASCSLHYLNYDPFSVKKLSFALSIAASEIELQSPLIAEVEKY